MKRPLLLRIASATFFASIALHIVWLSTSSAPIASADTSATSVTSAQTTQPYTYTLYLPVVARPYAWHLQLPPLITPWTFDVSPTNARPEYPRPQMTRDQWLNLNGEWEFASGTLYSSPPFSQTLPEAILVPYPVESGLSGIMRHEATMWYRRTFRVPPAWNGQRLMLNFDAVDWETTVYLNGQFIGTHRGGYDSFSFDITRHWIDGDNELIVYVSDPTDAGNAPLGKQRLRSRTLWYSAVSGIWQTVWLEPVPFGHITRLDMTPDIDQHVLRLIVHGTGLTDETVEAMASINGTPIGSITGPIGTELQLPVSNLRLWSPDDPFLYDLEVRLKIGSSVTDRVGSYFGMRQIERAQLGRYQRPLLNHQFVFQQGVLDQGYWPDGLYTAPTDEALRHDIEVAKALGYNLIRKHVKVEPQRWYYWADRLGMLVWQDMPSMQDHYSPSFSDQDQFRLELQAMIDEHRNSPSIVTWIIFNEAWGQFDTAQLTDMVKARDPSRLVDSASGWQDFFIGDVVDRHNYVKPKIPMPEQARLSAAGEYGGVGVRIDGHTWGPRGVSPEWQPDGAALSRRYLGLVDMLHDAMLFNGLSVAIYTQINDIEEELNGWQTYDRAVIKAAPDPISATQRHLIDASRALNAPYAHIAHWTFDDGQGYFAHDTGGQNYDGLLVNGPQWTTGLISGALHFDGTDDFVDIGHNLINTGADYTVAAWVRLDRLDRDAAVMSQDGRYTSAFKLHYFADKQRFAFTVAQDDSANPKVKTLRGPLSPQPGAWYFLTAVYDAASEQIRFYVNGALVNADAFDSTWLAPGSLAIGRAKWNDHFIQFWPGAIDDIRVFDRVLSDAEILALYNR